MNTTTIGFELTRARRRAGLTQREVADRMGTTQSAVSRVEAGRATPTLGFVDRYAEAVEQPIVITFGARDRSDDRRERARRVKRVLGDVEANPWDRDPSPAEQRVLERTGLTRERFENNPTARGR